MMVKRKQLIYQQNIIFDRIYGATALTHPYLAKASKVDPYGIQRYGEITNFIW
jgi:hypothetical protein